MPEIKTANRPAIERLGYLDGDVDAVVFGVPAGRWEVPNGPAALAIVTPRGNVVTLIDWQDWHTPLELGGVYPSPCGLPEGLGIPEDVRKRIVDIADDWGIPWSGGCSRGDARARVLDA